MPSQSHMTFNANKTDILILWQIQRDISGPGHPRRHRVDILNRATIIFVSACWESYIEDVAAEAFDFLLANAATCDAIPTKIRTLASRELREAKDERRVWELAGNGWQKVLQDHRDLTKSKWLKDFNTPKSSQVRDLFLGLLDIDITSLWHWESMSTDQACTELDEYMTIRGNIAHRTRHHATVPKLQGKKFLLHIGQLVDRTDNAITNHLNSLTGKLPWQIKNIS
ncbi:MAG: hypothetical protein K8S99_17310 [Planctomycetes bacterium]|nr:hypothetical protein [Planctomycetota bacterium]